MSQQYPQQPQQPQQGWPTPGPYGAPQPPKKHTGRNIGFGCLGVIALVIIIAVIAAIASSGGGDDTSSDTPSSSAPAAPDAKAGSAPVKETPTEKAPAPKLSQADQFKACVAKNGLPEEKKAVQHVTKVTGSGSSNNILDAAEVYTDYSGGLMGDDAAKGKLIASAFASCYHSKNGLVTVYDKTANVLSNGNY